MSCSSTKTPRILQNSTTPHQHHSSSAELVSTNEDVLTLILLGLPIKSLLKFKSVSKPWLSLITSPRFSIRRNPVPASPSGLFLFLCSPSPANPSYDYIPLHNNRDQAPFRSLTFVNSRSGIRVVQSCNGLFLCLALEEQQYYVYNPTTKHYSMLPPLENPSSVLGLYLAHDPSTTSHAYKVVCVTSNLYNNLNDHHLCQIELYSSDTGLWRASGAPFAADNRTRFKNGVFWNGSIHWTSDYGPLLVFDIEKAMVRQVATPVDQHGYRGETEWLRYFGESRGHLHLVESVGHPYDTQLNVYEMSRSGWFVKYEVDVWMVIDGCSGFSVLGLIREEEESYLVLYVPNTVVRYNLEDETFVKMWDCDFDRTQQDNMLVFGWMNTFQYFESLSIV